MSENTYYETSCRSRRVDVHWDPVTKKHSVTVIGSNHHEAVEFTFDLGPFLTAKIEVGDTSDDVMNAAGEVAVHVHHEVWAELTIRGQLIAKPDGSLHQMQVIDSPYGREYDPCGNLKETL